MPGNRRLALVPMKQAAHAHAAGDNQRTDLTARCVKLQIRNPAQDTAVADTDDVLFSQFAKRHAQPPLPFFLENASPVYALYSKI